MEPICEEDPKPGFIEMVCSLANEFFALQIVYQILLIYFDTNFLSLLSCHFLYFQP